MDVDDIVMSSLDNSYDLFAIQQLGGLNHSGQILTLLCSSAETNSSFLQRHDGPPPGSAGGSVTLFRIVFDLYVVGLICLVGFIGKRRRLNSAVLNDGYKYYECAGLFANIKLFIFI